MFNLYPLRLLATTQCQSVFRGLKCTFCTLQCSKCKNGIEKQDILEFFCKKCSWPVESTAVDKFNLYELFNIEPLYDVDKNQISKLYKQYQFILHPDRHGDRTQEELEIINSNSSIVSRYYKTILDDKERARRLFCMKYGDELFQREINKSDTDQLNYIIQVHEDIDELSSEDQLLAFKEEFKGKIEDVIANINKSFLENDPRSVLTYYRTLSFYRQVYDKLSQMSF